MKYAHLFIVFSILMFPSCTPKRNQKTTHPAPEQNVFSKTFTINIENHTPNELYGCCFYYAKGTLEQRWTWHKSEVITFPAAKTTPLTIPVTSTSQQDIKDIQGYLSLFHKKEKAEMAIMELLSDNKRIALGKLSTLDRKSVQIVAKKYGFKGEQLEYSFEPPKKPLEGEVSETFNLEVQNNVGKEIYLTGFVYEIAYSHPQWDFEKLPVTLIPSGKSSKITIPLENTLYNLENINGYLAIFNNNEKTLAEKCTYESLIPQNKLKLGVLSKINNKLLVLRPKVYGVLTGFDDDHPDIEFSLKPPRQLVNNHLYPAPPK